MLIEEHLQIVRVKTELIEEYCDVERYDRPDDDWLMRAAYVIAKGKQVRFSLWLDPQTWEREHAITSSRGSTGPSARAL